jgi:S1-C subfamily serine protease
MKKIFLILFSVGCIVPAPLSQASFTPTSQQLSSIVQIFSQQKSTSSNTYENMQWGSGYFISSDGTLLTNSHVVLSEKTYQPYDRYMICMTVSTNVPVCNYTASLIVSDADNDIALLRLDNKDISGNIVTTSIQPISWGDSFPLSIGQEIGILGYPDVGDKTITQTR